MFKLGSSIVTAIQKVTCENVKANLPAGDEIPELISYKVMLLTL